MLCPNAAVLKLECVSESPGGLLSRDRWAYTELLIPWVRTEAPKLTSLISPQVMRMLLLVQGPDLEDLCPQGSQHLVR